MLRVLHVLGGLHAGGMESMIMNYYRNINREKIQFDFLVFSDKAFFDDEVLALGGKIHRLTPRRKNPLKNYRELEAFFKENTNYKVVHIHQGINYFAPLAKAFKYQVPVRIVHSHGMDPKLIKKQGIIYDMFTKNYINKLGTNFVACSEHAAQQIFTNSRFTESKYDLLRNAIDTKKFHPNVNVAEEVRIKLGLKDKFVIGHVGNFTYPKNHGFILDVLREVNMNIDNAFLVLVGEGPELINIKEQVQRYGLTGKVLFLGVRDDIHRIIQAFDRFIFPSHYEGLSMALVEAQACGLRCIASKSVPNEAKITDLVTFVGLEEPVEHWAKEVLKNEDIHQNEDFSKIVEVAGYDIKANALWLEKYYSALLIDM